MKLKLAEIAGWYGAVTIVGAYALVSFGVVSSEGIVYQLLNLTGAIGILIISLVKRVFQSVALNIVWALIATAAITRLIFTN